MNIVFPDDFTRKFHPLIPGAKRWTYPSNEPVISIVGGGMGLHGDGVRTFEMFDFRESDPQDYMTIDEINDYLKSHPINPQ